MLMIKSKIKVKNVDYGKCKAELISAQINTRCGESQKIVVTYLLYRVWRQVRFFFILNFFFPLALSPFNVEKKKIPQNKNLDEGRT